jgi:hypothetical protein
VPFDPSTLLDVTHLATFLGGVAIGCAGQYMADKFTDKRRAKESRSSEKKQFSELRDAMPQLIDEMAKDLHDDTSQSIREFVITPNRRINFNHSKPRFVYFEEDHPHIQVQVDRLRDAGYLDDVTVGNASIYRMQEHFVRLVRAGR